ncbi:MAG TPA: acetolactate synthase small subunit [Lentisphaeria bacterium]|nr:MAG: acetolactate synthase small subunit [Lentisphaerae bacterium GWF2_38_69]HBM16117.1 acetolactate synthase small subunit [Lentisphaeria bacterium]
MQHVISVLVENKFGVLARIAGLFCGRGYNIDSLTVSPTNEEGVSKMTIATSGDDAVIEQIEKQLSKLIDVISVSDLTGKHFIERELLLIKVNATAATRSELMQITEIFKGKIVNVHESELTIELSGRGEKIDAFIKMMAGFGIIDLARTGKVAIGRKPGPSHFTNEV